MSRSEDLKSVVNRIAVLRERRDSLILELHKEGHSLRTIAGLAGVSHPTVLAIVSRKRG